MAIWLPTKAATVLMGPALAAALENRWENYRAQLRRCRRKCSEAAVHELRVATRRLLAQLVLLGDVAPSTALEKARQILKRRLRALGELRDTHVQLLFVDQQLVRFTGLVLLRSWLERRERRLIKLAIPEVRRSSTRKLDRWISALVEDLTASRGGSRAQRRLAAALLQATAAAFGKAVKRRQAIKPADLRTVHQTRVAFKRFRYMVEALSPTLTGLSRRQLRALAYYQRRMGIIQDLEVIRDCVARYVQDHRKQEALLRPFCRHLRQRRTRALRSFIQTADRLFDFWPPAKLAASGRSA